MASNAKSDTLLKWNAGFRLVLLGDVLTQPYNAPGRIRPVTETMGERLERICNRLDELMAHDRRLIDPSASQPVTISLATLEQYGRNYEERQRLNEELADLASKI